VAKHRRQTLEGNTTTQEHTSKAKKTGKRKLSGYHNLREGNKGIPFGHFPFTTFALL